jgi:hypothetical protein
MIQQLWSHLRRVFGCWQTEPWREDHGDGRDWGMGHGKSVILGVVILFISNEILYNEGTSEKPATSRDPELGRGSVEFSELRGSGNV